MAVSDRSSRQRSADEDEEEEEPLIGGMRRPLRGCMERGEGGRNAREDGVKIKRYFPARESRDAYIICISGIARAEQKWLRD